MVPVKVVPLSYEGGDRDEVVRLLVEFNSQRVKGVEELFNETLVKVDPAAIREYQRESEKLRDDIYVGNGQSVMTVGSGGRRRSGIGKSSRAFADDVLEVVNGLREFWPMSLRAVHYRMLGRKIRKSGDMSPLYQNDRQSYQYLSKICVKMRISGEMAWDAICDQTRPVSNWRRWQNPQSFISDDVENFLKGYRRDRLQSQPDYIEVVGEKMTIEPIIRPICAEFGVPYLIGRGFASVDSKRRLAERFKASGKRRLSLLCLSDFDPSGNEISESLVRSLKSDFRIYEIHAVRVALTPSQVKSHKLPPYMKVKRSDSRARGFVAEFGEYAYELEALDPETLQGILRDSIRSVLDVDLYNRELETEEDDCRRIIALKLKAAEVLRGLAL